jgi:hypothetical protein
MNKFHVAARFPYTAKAPGQFAQAIAVNEIHPLEINQELLMAVASEDVNKVAQLSATVSQRESPHNIDHNDAIALSRCDLKTHICFCGLAFLSGIICLVELALQGCGCISVESCSPPQTEGEDKAYGW